METELEGKWLNIDLDSIRRTLRSNGAERIHPERLMVRVNFDLPDKSLESKGGWVRVRDEGDKVTLSYKQLSDRTLHGTKEVMVTVNDFKTACDLLRATGFKQTSHQETKRESWKLGAAEIELDTWPWIPSFVEIEAPSEAQLIGTANMLGLDMKDVLHGSVEVAYQAVYDVSEAEVDAWPTIHFSDTPDWLEPKRKH
jgi:adenylate cyclase, class 2